MPDGLPQVQLVIWGMLLAATPTTAYALFMPKKYASAQFYMPLAPEFDADRLILITLSMIAIGVVGLVIWDGVFPDRRDVRILGVLPIPTRRLRARAAGLARPGIRALRHAALHAAVAHLRVDRHRLRRVDLEDSRHHRALPDGGAGLRLRVLRARSPRSACCCCVFGRRAAQAASVTFQVLFAVGLVQLLFFLPDLGRALRLGGASHEGLSRLSAIPPTWFFALYERLAGTAYGGTETLARLAMRSHARDRRRRGGALCDQLRPPVAARARGGHDARFGVVVHAASPAPAVCRER